MILILFVYEVFLFFLVLLFSLRAIPIYFTTFFSFSITNKMDISIFGQTKVKT